MALRDLWAKLTGREKDGREKDGQEPEPPAAFPAPEQLAPIPAPVEPPPPEAAPEPPAGAVAPEAPAPETPAPETPVPEAPAPEQPQPAAHSNPAATAPAPAETRSAAEELPPPPPLLPMTVAPPETRSDAGLAPPGTPPGTPPRAAPKAMPEAMPEPGQEPEPAPATPPQPQPQPQPGDLPAVPAELPPRLPPAMPPPPPPGIPAPPALPEWPAPSPAEQPAPPMPPSPAPAAPPGWQPSPTEWPAPVPPAPPVAPPPGIPARPFEPEIPPPPTTPEEPRGGFFSRLKTGLSRSTARLTGGITGLFTKRKLDDAALEELEEALITADLGVSAAQRIVAGFRRTRFGREVGELEVKEALAEEIAAILAPVALPLELDSARRPHVVLVVGVNGTGKTTTIAKLGQQFREQGRSVTFVAGDTFRAAAVEQLQIWGERTGCAVVAPAKEGADAAGLAFDALKQAQAQGTEVLLVDTAGRLHNKAALMEELRKVVRVMQRLDPSAPHSVLLVLDATTGQNATQQCKVFGELVNVTGLVVTKLDGSAKGGIVVALAQEFGLPVHAVGVGEKAADLRPFSARDFARSLLGLN